MHPLLQKHKADVATIVLKVLHELETVRRDVLEDYTATRGRTDWVWLEETLSLYLSEQLPDNGDVVASLRYYAAFTLTMVALRERYPQIGPPAWLPEATRPLALEGMQALVDAGENEGDVVAFIVEHTCYCDDADGSRGARGENVYGELADLMIEWDIWKDERAADPDSPYCKPRGVYMRRAVRRDLIDRGHHPSFVDEFIASRDDAWFAAANFNTAADAFARWKRN